ncbi:MAG: hypothetical protein KAW14_10080 [Candidatus Aegiribacteria sp.]|nr:hypothetical protein [Candidatus Aegiribacteria sp.]
MRYLFPFVSFLFLVSLLSSCGEGQTDTAEPAAESETVRELAFLDSIGVELGDSNYVFGSIESSSHSLNGNILILDRPACCVREYTPEGEFVRNFGRRGSGPGEFVNPLSMARLSDGRIAVMDLQAGGIHTFLSDGEWEGLSADINREPVLNMTATDNSMYIALLTTFDAVDGQLIMIAKVGRFDIDETEPSLIYWENSLPVTFDDFTLIIEEGYLARVWASNFDGIVFIASRDSEEYLITGFDANGNEFVEISLDLPQVKKSEEEIRDEAAFYNQRARNMGYGAQTNYEPNPFRWKIHSMGIDDQKRLWVRRGTEEIPTFDIFDFEGNHLFTANIPAISGYSGLLWEIKIDEYGILAWSLNPSDGYQKLYTLELEE